MVCLNDRERGVGMVDYKDMVGAGEDDAVVCFECIYYQKAANECRCDAPRVDRGGWREWPKVGEQDWCGEWIGKDGVDNGKQ
jgi:hypothetical protein